ncbi:hypothetical protein H6P81_004978 [Aristolochia fimbriata]|uniref:Uncharacterized protein n=1 Tax=Aristolochia fimbriata TaxID=158543 RepID=A0AAV7EU64_ARIFI|nr:hypothetical protein H6P81_004978 [Aristolochia fimbriata]
MRKHLSDIANTVLRTCSETLGTSEDALVAEFERGLKAGVGDYSRKLVEFCSSKTLSEIVPLLDEKINDGKLSRTTFDMMLAWEKPSAVDEQSYSESVAKEKEDINPSVYWNEAVEQQDDIPLFYSDLMPLLVDDKESVGEDAFVWFGSLFPLASDVVNGHFTFKALTSTTMNRLHFPAYDIFLKEIDKCTKHLKKQTTPTEVELRGDEFILLVEGTASTQRVVRHIGTSSWPGRLTLTNYGLYFEASGVISYENALKIDLSRTDLQQKVATASTGPWGAPLFDKAMLYESPEFEESIIFEFPEMTSSTRRDLWFTLTKEIVFLHQFLSKFQIQSPIQTWEMHCRTILGILRLHAAREMLRISLPVPSSFLVFSLYDELPKGDYVLEELASGLKQMNYVHPCSATSVLSSLDVSRPPTSNEEQITGVEHKEKYEECMSDQAETFTSLETTITQVREEAKEISIARASIGGLNEDGIADSILVLLELVSPLTHVLPFLMMFLNWERPAMNVVVITIAMVVMYKEWVGYTIAACLLSIVAVMLWARYHSIGDKYTQIKIDTSSDKTTMESIVDAQHGLKSFHSLVRTTNITILKIRSLLLSKAPKQTNFVMLGLAGVSLVLMLIPFKFILMAAAGYWAVMNSKVGKYMKNEQGNRRRREWWSSIPVVPVRTADKTS